MAVPLAAFATTSMGAEAGGHPVRGTIPDAGSRRIGSTPAFVTDDPDPDVFGIDGKVGVHGAEDSDDFLVGMALTPEGKILASGFALQGAGDEQVQPITVTRRAPDGSPDRTFGKNGVALLRDLQGEAEDVEATADGGVIGTGFEIVAGQANTVVFRLDAAGKLDPAFGQDGVVHFPSTEAGFGTHLATQADGKIVVVGLSSPTPTTTDISIRRLLPDGAPDLRFGTDGATTVDLAGSDQANSVKIQPDGKIVVVGRTSLNNDAVALRLTVNGSLDDGFGNGGIAALNADGLDVAFGLELQPDGKIDVVGETRPTTSVPRNTVIFRLLPTGQPDPSLNGSGQVVLGNPGNDSGFGIGLGPDGSIVTSSFQVQQRGVVTDSFLNRITSTGKLDPHFGTNGTVQVHNPEPTFELGLQVQRDGKIVTAGRRGGVNVENSIGTIDRFNPDGSFDTTADVKR